MTAIQQAVYDTAKEIYSMRNPPQILIDLVQEGVEELFSMRDANQLQRDSIGSVAYSADIILEVFDPERATEVEFLTRLKVYLSAWVEEHEQANKLLGLPPES